MKKKRKVLAYALTAVMTAGMLMGMPQNARIAQAETCGEIIVSGGTKGTDYDYDENNGRITVKTDKELTFSSSEFIADEKAQIYVDSGVNANLVLNNLKVSRLGATGEYATNKVDSIKPLIEIADDSDGTVTISMKNSNLLAGNFAPAIQKNGSNGTLVIQGEGSLDVSAYTCCAYDGDTYNTSWTSKAGAAIGSAHDKEVSGIEIKSGTVNATTFSGGAAIGSGYNGSAKNITISGGTVNAMDGAASDDPWNDEYVSVKRGAAIGSGAGNVNSDAVDGITISGGIVTATSKYCSAIGGGLDGSVQNITISGGTVIATTSAETASAIGSGEYGNATGITISGGKVTATATGADGAGIGNGGKISNTKGEVVTTDITIIGGTVVAKGGVNAPGIGAAHGSSALVYIRGGSVNASTSGSAADAIGLSSFAKNNSSDGYVSVFRVSDTNSVTPVLQEISGSNANTRVSLTLEKDGIEYKGYGTKDIFTDSESKVYLYLPAGVEASITEPDTTPPTVSGVSLTAVDASSANIQFTIADNKSTSCDYAYVVLPSSQSSVPTNYATVKSTSGAVTGSGIGQIAKSVENLTPGQSYILYVAAKDNSGNEMTTVVKSSALTMSKAALTVETSPTFTGEYGTKLSDMTVSSPGKVTYNNVTVEGTWSLTGDEVPSKGDKSYTATFTPKDTSKYDSITSTATVTVTARNISNVTVGSIASQAYTGSAITPGVTVTDSGATITSSDYEINYSNNIKVGTATVTITGKGNYTGEKITTFQITTADISNVTVAPIADQTYTGSPIVPALTVTSGSKQLTSDDYTVSCTNNINVGTATVTITGKVNYKGSTQTTFKITEKGIEAATVDIANQTYTGSEIKPSVKVTVDGNVLTSGDYDVSYSNNTNVGSATVTITGKGNYTGQKISSFQIEKAPSTASNQTLYVVKDSSQSQYQYDMTKLIGSSVNKDLMGTVSYTVNKGSEGIVKSVSNDESTLNITLNSGLTSDATQDITVTISSTNYKDITATLTISVTDKKTLTLSGVGAPQNAVYNGSAQGYTGTIKWSSEDGVDRTSDVNTTVTYTGTTNANSSYSSQTAPTEAGSYTVTFTVTENDTYIGTRSYDYTIAQQTIDVSGLSWQDTKTFTYNGQSHSVALKSYPDTVTCEYSGNTAINADCYTATVRITPKTANYKVINSVAACEWKIVEASSGGDNPGGNNDNPGGNTDNPGGDNSNSGGNTNNSQDDEKKYIPAIGTEQNIGGMKYVVTEADVTGGTVKYTGPADKSVTSVKIPETVAITTAGKTKNYEVTTITADAFKGCNSLTSITIGNNITTIEDNAFKGLKKLKTVTFGNKVTTIGKNAFKDCKVLTTVKLPNSVKSIGSSAFSGCKALKTVKMGSGLTSIATSTFSGCSKLSSVTIGSNVTKIGDKAFYKCTALKKITIPKKVTTIGKQTFYGCKKLATITLKTSSLTKVGSKAIKGISKKAVIKCPSKKKVSKYKKLFKGSTGYVKTMKIKK